MRPIALWATPRSASTAFDKMVRTRGDLTVLTEPFSVPYYDGPEQRSTRFPVTEPDATFEATLATVLGSDRPRFLKEMAYQLGPLLRPDVLERFTSSFLVREPAWAVPSLLRVWPDATREEAGYDAQLAAFELVTDIQGASPPVLDTDDLRREPDGAVERWCVGGRRRPPPRCPVLGAGHARRLGAVEQLVRGRCGQHRLHAAPGRTAPAARGPGRRAGGAVPARLRGHGHPPSLTASRPSVDGCTAHGRGLNDEHARRLRSVTSPSWPSSIGSARRPRWS